jgi:hypothetical protein
MEMKMNKKIATAKKIVSKVSIPSKNKIENSQPIFNFQIGKIILQIRKE